jgi:hypothetical protein
MIYETMDDRVRQVAAIAGVADFYGVIALDLPTLSPFDALLREDRRIVGALEVKCRNCERERYPDVWVNVATVWSLRLAHATFSFDPYADWLGLVAIRWTDGLFAIPIDVVARCPKGLRTRNDMRDAGDKDNPVYLVPTHLSEWNPIP